jgi:regulator of replication initiation timing
VTEVSQAVNEHLIEENARLTAENKELRDTVSFARDQWKLMQQVVERLDRMDKRLQSIEHNSMNDYDPDVDRLRRIKADRISYGTGTNDPFR